MTGSCDQRLLMKPSSACLQVLPNPVGVERTGPSPLESIPLSVVKLKKCWPPLLIWLFSHTSDFSCVKIAPLSYHECPEIRFPWPGALPFFPGLPTPVGYRIIILTCPWQNTHQGDIFSLCSLPKDVHPFLFLFILRTSNSSV